MKANSIAATELSDQFKASLRSAAASVSLVAARDDTGQFHGMAVTSATSLSMEPPSMLVAVNKSASIHPVILKAGRFSLNLMADRHSALLQAFSRSDLRDQRFRPEDWRETADGLPVLNGALSVHLCTVEAAHGYGSHTVFFGRVDHVLLSDSAMEHAAPLIWLSGARALVACHGIA